MTLTITPTIMNFFTERGSNFKRTLVLKDDDDNILDTSLMTASMKVKKIIPKTYKTAEVLGSAVASITTSSGITMGGTNGQVTLNIPAATTASIEPGLYYYQLVMNCEGIARVTGVSTMYFSTPDSAGSSVTSDIDLRAKVRLNDWTPTAINTIISKWNTSTQSYLLAVDTTGKIKLQISQTGSDSITPALSSVGTAVSDKTDKWIRATWDQSASIAQFYLSDNGASWTQLGTDQALSAASIHDNASALWIGRRQNSTTEQLNGIIYYAEVRNGIDGTVVARFDPRTYTTGSTWAAAGTGETWTANGSPTMLKKDIVTFEGTIEFGPEATY